MYGICETVHFPSNEIFFSRLKRGLEDFHTEAITIAMANMTPEKEASNRRSFAGVLGHEKTTNRVHAFSPKRRKKKKTTEATRNTMSSP